MLYSEDKKTCTIRTKKIAVVTNFFSFEIIIVVLLFSTFLDVIDLFSDVNFAVVLLTESPENPRGIEKCRRTRNKPEINALSIVQASSPIKTGLWIVGRCRSTGCDINCSPGDTIQTG